MSTELTELAEGAPANAMIMEMMRFGGSFVEGHFRPASACHVAADTVRFGGLNAATKSFSALEWIPLLPLYLRAHSTIDFASAAVHFGFDFTMSLAAHVHGSASSNYYA